MTDGSLSLIALSILYQHTGYCKVLVVVVEWLAGKTATLAMQASFAQQCVHHAVDIPTRTQHQPMH